MTTIIEKNKKVVLAFSGGLDTSFCVPYLIAQGYQVTTLFVDSGGVTEDEKKLIRSRAIELGATDHRQVNIGKQLWQKVITPLIQSGEWYQNQYPLLCSDRYLIVEACLKLCDEIGTKNFAHGCTGMGNDQVRFDIAVSCLGDYNVLSPIREIQKITSQVREYEKNYLLELGFSISDKVSTYSINQNLMGTTISGSEIDQWQQPADASYVLTSPPQQTKSGSQFLELKFVQGVLMSLKNNNLSEQDNVQFNSTDEPETLIQFLNQLAGSYSIGRGVYTGDTTIGLKGRIVFEAPALQTIKIAHTALEQAVLSKSQNRFKKQLAEKWTELVYEGLFYDPLKKDIEAFLTSSQQQVTGSVTVQLSQGQVHAVAIESNNILKDQHSVYAQSSSWSIEEAVGFIKLFGQSSSLAAKQLLTKQEVQ